MNVDQHIAKAQKAFKDVYVRGNEDIAISLLTIATAHSTMAAALLARYPGYDYAGCTPGEYEGIDTR